VEQVPGLEFPCNYPVKVMADSTPTARREILAVIAAHTEFCSTSDVRYRAGRNGRFESITITVRAESREQLEGLYQALRDLQVVKMML
jgi:putative lipoic acid-binding regulatory protein